MDDDHHRNLESTMEGSGYWPRIVAACEGNLLDTGAWPLVICAGKNNI